jgi:hypothetical protein
MAGVVCADVAQSTGKTCKMKRNGVMSDWKSEEDGISHINIYSRGKTPLGRFLSNFALAPFTEATLGRFASVEGLWYYLSTGRQHEMLRDLHGFEAKKQGKALERVEMPSDQFEKLIKVGITAKLLANPKMLNTLIECELPLAHYYTYGTKVVDAGYEWLVEYHDHIRRSCREKNWRAKC